MATLLEATGSDNSYKLMTYSLLPPPALIKILECKIWYYHFTLSPILPESV